MKLNKLHTIGTSLVEHCNVLYIRLYTSVNDYFTQVVFINSLIILAFGLVNLLRLTQIDAEKNLGVNAHNLG